MSTELESADAPLLDYWIRELVAALDTDPLGGGLVLRSIVGSRRARIGLDGELFDVDVRRGRLHVRPADATMPVDGGGSTSSDVVIALLDGRIEVTEAFHDGSIQAIGSRDSIGRIFHAIELLLDAASRVPRLRELAAEFRTRATSDPNPSRPRVTSNGAELDLLDRLGLSGEYG
jgi:hypothetical protein